MLWAACSECFKFIVNPDPNPQYALALGSSFMGFYSHAGFMAGLENGGVVPGHLAGASSGGVIAGLAASGLGTDEVEEVLMDPWFPKYFLEWSAFVRGWGALFNMSGYGGPLSGVKLKRRLAEVVGVDRIEDCPRSLHVAATNLTSGRSEMVERGPLAEFLVASCAMPFVFRPQEIDGDHYWDGGITHDLPMGQWAETPEVTTVIGHRITWDGDGLPQGGKLKVSAAFNLAHRAICRDGMRPIVDRLEAAGKRIVQVRTHGPTPGVIQSVAKRREIYRAGFDSGVEAAAEIKTGDSVG